MRDPRVHAIAFTGSGAVGPRDPRAPPPRRPTGQRHLKRVVAEMGGKNCVIVDADADLDEVVPGARRSPPSATPGQKCSAAARVLVHEAIADDAARAPGGRGRGAATSARPSDFATDVPPVIEREAQERVAALPRRAGATPVAAAPATVPDEGWFVRADARRRTCPTTRPCCSEEIFGPLLAVERVADVDEACDVVDALAVRAHRRPVLPQPARRSSTSPRRSPVGNLYVNREITGAMVGRQPFGGNRRSGTGSKAGGPDYLLQFVEPRVVTENTMRHGIPVD